MIQSLAHQTLTARINDFFPHVGLMGASSPITISPRRNMCEAVEVQRDSNTLVHASWHQGNYKVIQLI